MTIHITRPEVEALIKERLQSGSFKDAEDVILHALQDSTPKPQTSATHPAKSLQQIFEDVRGLAEYLDFRRNPSTGRPVDLP